MACGASADAETDKVAANNIEMMARRTATFDSGGHPAGDSGYLAAVGGGGRPYPAHLSGGQFLGDEDKKGPVCPGTASRRKIAPAVKAKS